MTTAPRLEELAARVEAEEPSGDLWMAAYAASIPFPKRTPELRDRFAFLIDVCAHLDAADMLRPRNWKLLDAVGDDEFFDVTFERDEDAPDGSSVWVMATVTGPHAESRARLAAALRARAAMEATDG